MFTIKLKDGYSQTLDKSKFIALFPGSMISSALNDKTATEIDITSPHVTPNVLDLIKSIVEHKKVPYPHKCARDELTSASRYLLIEELEVIANPLYRLFVLMFPGHDLLNVEYTSCVMDFAIKENYSELALYILNSIYKLCDISPSKKIIQN